MAPNRRKGKDKHRSSVTRNTQNKNKPTLRRRMKAASKLKRKTQPEVSQRRLRRRCNSRPSRKHRHSYNLRNNSSVILIGAVPCCTSEEQRKKLARLNLDSALFCLSPTPAKRKQSHVSIITISSSDDCENLDRTAEWVANMDVDAPGNLGEEEIIALKGGCQSETTQGASTEMIQTKMSLLHLPTSSSSIHEPLCTLETNQNSESQQCEQIEAENMHTIVPRSFLTNPSKHFNETDTHENNFGPLFSPNQQSGRTDMADSPLGNHPRFYFGHRQVTRDAETPTASGFDYEINRQQSSPFTNFLFCGASSQTQNSSGNCESERQQNNEARQRSLLQVPSTSSSPVLLPVLNTGHSTSSKSDNS